MFPGWLLKRAHEARAQRVLALHDPEADDSPAIFLLKLPGDLYELHVVEDRAIEESCFSSFSGEPGTVIRFSRPSVPTIVPGLRCEYCKVERTSFTHSHCQACGAPY